MTTSLAAMLQGGTFKRNFVCLARANTLALVLPIITLPLLSRLFSPEDFGLLAVFTAVVAVLLSFATWRMEWSLPNTKSMVVAANTLAAGIIILLACSLSLVSAVLVGWHFARDLQPLAQLGASAWLLPLAVLGGGLRQLLEGWYVRIGNLSLIGQATVMNTTSNIGLSVGTGFGGLGGIGLVVSFLASTGTSLWVLGSNAADSLRCNLRRISTKSVKCAAKRYLGSATWSTAVSVANASSFNVPLLALAIFYGPQQVGCYALVNRMVAAPMGAMSSALGQSFWAHSAELARKHDYAALRSTYLKTTLLLGAASTLVMAACLAAPFFVGPLLGEDQWKDAGLVMLSMTPLFIGGLVFSPTNHLVVLERQPLQLLADGVRLTLMLLGLGAAVFFNLGFIIAVFFLSLGSFCGHASLFLIHLICHGKLRKS